MNGCTRKLGIKPFLIILMLAALSIQCKPSGAPSAVEEGDSIRIRFSMEPETVLRYKGTSTDEMSFYGMTISNVHTDEVTLKLREKTEEGNYAIRIKYDKSSDRMIRSGEMYQRSAQIKPEGRTVEVDVSPAGEIVEARGVIPGLPEGGLEDYVGKWFAELPEKTVTVGQSWEKDVSDTTGAGKIEGTITMTLDGIGEEKGMAVAYLSGDAVTSIEREAAGGVVKGEATADIEASVALDGGYVVIYKMESEFKGNMTGVNPETAREETTDISRTSYTSVELIK